MHEPNEMPPEEQQHLNSDDLDAHFHDDDDDVPVDDMQPRRARPPAPRGLSRRLPPRRYDYDD